MGPRPLGNGVSSRPYVIFDLGAGYEHKGKWCFEVEVENLLDTEWDDTSFHYESRPDPNVPAAFRKHITPGTPFALKLKFTVLF